ncbi:odorant receptor 131-2-like [Alosa sapidissima]|uniref:odorant receptor 131-2-like n=1 Tax=Alosa sapidissima TaxID=34773 RepID=UPI001C087409|nr:odorant receptor 131-2-like [Alosa sapidissima]
MQNTTDPESANFSSPLNTGLAVKAFLSMTPCFLFLYVNIVMLVTLRSKELFCETPRYMLFGQLLLSDSLQLSSSIMSYLLALARLYLASSGCALYYLVQRVINAISPLFLALMSLERYVAVCFPLRHAEIANRRRTTAAIIAVWLLGVLIWSVELTASMMFEILSPNKQMFCLDYGHVQMEISFSISQTFTGIIFTSVSLVTVYTYVAILVTARSATSDRTSASKAHRTILLHMVQLALCLASTLFGVLRRALATSRLRPAVVYQVQYVLFVGVIIFPRCLSPFIYGLRDKTFCAVFKYVVFFCMKRKVEPQTCVI